MIYLTTPKIIGKMIYGLDYHLLTPPEEILWRCGYIQGQQDLFNSINKQNNERLAINNNVQQSG